MAEKKNDHVIIEKDNRSIYFENEKPVHKGIIKIGDNYYYASKNGEIIQDRFYIVHSTMTNNLVKKGTYYFDEKGKLDFNSYIPPKRKRIKKHKKKIFTRKFKIALSIALALVLLFSVSIVLFYQSKSNIIEDEYQENSNSVVIPSFNDAVYLCSYPMQLYYKGEITFSELVHDKVLPYKGLEFNYHVINNGTLEIDGRYYPLESSKKTIIIDNLKTGFTYDFTVSVDEKEYKGSVTTEKTNRFVKILGIQNTRDIGGYLAMNNKRIKQGMIIRGTEIDGLVEKDYILRDKDDVQDFGFKYDMDLRDESVFFGEYISPLGNNVKHKFYGSPMYDDCFEEENYKAIRDIFTDLAKEENYPMYMHCTYGADRTGSIVYILQGLLGVSYSDMSFEYQLTNLYPYNLDVSTNLTELQLGISKQKGDTLIEKIENYLIGDVGVSVEDINSIRNILLE